jgi:hypothetical protein
LIIECLISLCDVLYPSLEHRQQQLDAHPMYGPQDFVCGSRAFSAWRRNEAAHVATVLDKMRQHRPKDPQFCGSLTVRVHRARGLFAKDSNGFSDPFVALEFQGARASTFVVAASLDPVWEQTFEFDMRGSGILEVMVWDKDTVTRNQFLGRIRLPAGVVRGGSVARQWHVLEQRSHKSRVSGELELTVRTTPFLTPSPRDPLPACGVYFDILARRCAAFDAATAAAAGLGGSAMHVLHEFGVQHGIRRMCVCGGGSFCF